MDASPESAKANMFLHDLFDRIHPKDFIIKLWNGMVLKPDDGTHPRFTLMVRSPGALKSMFFHPNELSLGEAYIYNDIDVEGDLEGALGLTQRLAAIRIPISLRIRALAQILRLPSPSRHRTGRQAARLTGQQHSLERDRQAVRYHYDVSNAFYRLWLDNRMVYSTAYFETPGDSIDGAQERKLDYICRKLLLRKGERLLDIGCGWGGLLIHAARKFGAECLGITLSRPQAELAVERIDREGLTDRCRVEVRDYREVDSPTPFDKVVSVGMVEHVGASRLAEYFQSAWRNLQAGGLFLNHGIAQTAAEPKKKSASFSDKYVFPDGDVLPVNSTLRAAEEAGFEIRDVESLREHYALTLRQWVKRLEANHGEAVRVTDEATYRIWRLYMCASAQRFSTGRLNVYQVLLAKPADGKSGLPLTRASWYS